MAQKFYLPRALYRLMLEHCQSEKPLEACGIFGGNRSGALIGYPLTNKLASPIAYQADEAELSEAWADMKGRGCQIVAIYHSHPTSAAVPSRTDILKATYPEAVYIIVSLAETRPKVGAYRIVDGATSEVTLVLTDEHDSNWIDLRPQGERESDGGAGVKSVTSFR